MVLRWFFYVATIAFNGFRWFRTIGQTMQWFRWIVVVYVHLIFLQTRSDYRIRLNGDWDMDIPKGYHQLKQYCATLAHKANHSFTPNVEWGIFEHPRFGLIRSLRAIRDLKKGDEV